MAEEKQDNEGQQQKKRLTKKDRENIEKINQYQSQIKKTIEERLKTELKLNKLSKENTTANKSNDKFIKDSYVLQSKINALKKLEKDLKKEILNIQNASLATNTKTLNSQTAQNKKVKETLEDKIKLLEIEKQIESEVEAVSLGIRHLASEIQLSSKETKNMFNEYGVGKDIISNLSSSMKNNLDIGKKQSLESVVMKQHFSDITGLSEDILKNVKEQVYQIDTSNGKQIELIDISTKERDLQNIITSLHEEKKAAIESGNSEQERFVDSMLESTDILKEMLSGFSGIQDEIKQNNEALEKTISISNKIGSITESFNKIQTEIEFANKNLSQFSNNANLTNDIFQQTTSTLKLSNQLTRSIENTKLTELFSEVNQLTKDVSSNLLNQIEEINKAEEGKIKIIDLLEIEYSLARKKQILEKELNKAIEEKNVSEQSYIELQLNSIENINDLIGVHKKLTKESEAHNKVLEKQEAINKRIAGIISGLVGKLPGGKYLTNMLRLDEVATGAITAKEAFGSLGTEIRALGAAISALSGTALALIAGIGLLIGGFAAYIFVMKKIIELIVDMDSKIAKVGKNFTISYSEASKLRIEAQKIAKEMNLVGINTDQVIEGMTKIVDIMNGINPVLFTANTVFIELTKSATILSERFGISQDEISKLFKVSVALGRPFNDIVLRTVVLGKNILTTKESLRALANISVGVASTFKGTVDNLIMAEQKAKLLGTTLKELRNIGTGFLDIETSLRQEMEARVLTGRQIDLDPARYYTLTGQFDKLQEEILKVMGSLDDFKKMNFIQQTSLSQLFGMDVDQMSEFLANAEQLQKLGISQTQLTDLQKMSADQLNVELEKARATGNAAYVEYLEKLAKEKESLEITERYNDVLTKIKESLIDVVGPIADIVNQELKRLQNSGELQQIIESIKVTIKEMVKILPELIKQLPNIINGLLSMANATASIAQNFDKILGVAKLLGLAFLFRGGMKMMGGGGGPTAGGPTSMSASIGGFSSTTKNEDNVGNVLKEYDKTKIQQEKILIDYDKERRDKALYESYRRPYSNMYQQTVSENSENIISTNNEYDPQQKMINQTEDVKKKKEWSSQTGLGFDKNWKESLSENLSKKLEWYPGGFLYDSVSSLYDVGNLILSTVTGGKGEGVLYPKGGGLPEWMRAKNDPRYMNYSTDQITNTETPVDIVKTLPYKYRFSPSDDNLKGISPLESNKSIYPGIPNIDITPMDAMENSIDTKIEKINYKNESAINSLQSNISNRIPSESTIASLQSNVINRTLDESKISTAGMQSVFSAVPQMESAPIIRTEPQETKTFDMNKTIYTDKLLESKPTENTDSMVDIGKKLDTLINVLTAAVSQPTIIKLGERTIEAMDGQINLRKTYSDTVATSYGRI